MARPYIGVGGVGSMEEQGQLVDIAIAERFLNAEMFLMVGVTVTSKTLQGQEDAYGSSWHPTSSQLPAVAGNEDSGMTKVFMHCHFTPDHTLAANLHVLDRLTRHYSKGVQLNGLPWLEEDFNDVLSWQRERLQIGAIALSLPTQEAAQYRPLEIANRLGRLPVDYVVFDAGTKVEDLAPPLIGDYIDAIYQSYNGEIGVAVSGLLDAADTTRYLSPLTEDHGDISVYSEAALRSGEPGESQLDISKAHDFIRAALGAGPTLFDNSGRNL